MTQPQQPTPEPSQQPRPLDLWEIERQATIAFANAVNSHALHSQKIGVSPEADRDMLNAIGNATQGIAAIRRLRLDEEREAAMNKRAHLMEERENNKGPFGFYDRYKQKGSTQ